MLNIIILLLIFVVAVVYGIYYYRVKQRKKASQAVMKKRLAAVERIKSGFKVDLEKLTSLGVLSEQGQDSIYRLASYYFVYQPATAESVEECEQVLKRLLMAIHDKMKDGENNNPVFMRLHLDDFALALPRTVAGYNASFYKNELPVLIQQLVEAQGMTVQEKKSLQSYFKTM